MNKESEKRKKKTRQGKERKMKKNGQKAKDKKVSSGGPNITRNFTTQANQNKGKMARRGGVDNASTWIDSVYICMYGWE